MISPHEISSTDTSPDAYRGEVTPAGVTAVLSALLPLLRSDVFLDVGSGIGDIIAHVALATQTGMAIGIEFQDHLAQLSKTIIYTATASLPNFAKVFIHSDVVQTKGPATQDAMHPSTNLFSNNLVFDPSSNDVLKGFVTNAPNLVHLVTKLCWRHRGTCKQDFCSVWQLRRTIEAAMSWSAKPHEAFWYIQ
ncbi:hypothetical protein PC116_g27415 [Phytophthora cactorum]|nr:hypothetical protein PC114_g26177 [Phytophthora cactorum]KAG4224128.1 hypothetical protein PC116_g27415 [Phytophthora cactorum]